MRGLEKPLPPSFFFDPDQRIPADHPLREIKNLIDPILEDMSGFFDTLYAESGRPSILPNSFSGLWCFKPCIRSAANDF